MKMILLLLAFSACSLFKDDEEIQVHNPKPGTRLIIEEDPLPLPVK